MSVESATGYGSAGGPAQQLREVFAVGEFTIVLRWDDREQTVTSTGDIDEAYQPGVPQPGIVLYQPRHLFVLPEVLGVRCVETDGYLTLDLGDDASVRVTELEAVPLVEGAFYGRLSDDDPDARAVVERLEGIAGDGHAGVGLSHGYRLWSHIAWWSHVAWWGDVADAGGPERPKPPEFPEVRPPGSASPAFGLIDVGVDTDHVWLTSVVGSKPLGKKQADSHGTQVAGVLHQASPGSTIYAEGIPHKAHVVQVKMIVKALEDLAEKPDVGVVVMSFGGEKLSDWDPLGDAIATFVANAGGARRTVFAAAGNLETENGQPITRRTVYPAAFPDVRAVAGGPSTETHPKGSGPAAGSGKYYDWSNGGPWVTDIISVTNAARDDGFLFTSYLTNAWPGAPDPNTFAYARGTSLLAPIAAAAAIANATNPFPDYV